jgi:hypothetical protein
MLLGINMKRSLMMSVCNFHQLEGLNTCLDTASPWLAQNRNDEIEALDCVQPAVRQTRTRYVRAHGWFCAPLRKKAPFSSRQRGSVGSCHHIHDCTHSGSGCKRGRGTSHRTPPQSHSPPQDHTGCHHHRKCYRDYDPDCESSANVARESQAIASC